MIETIVAILTLTVVKSQRHKKSEGKGKLLKHFVVTLKQSVDHHLHDKQFNGKWEIIAIAIKIGIKGRERKVF